MKQLYLLVLVMALFCYRANGQNLVMNPGFEDHTTQGYCLSGPYSSAYPFPALNWQPYASPDYFHPCAPNAMYNPGQKAQSVRSGGQAYTGFIAYYQGHEGSQEFLVQSLNLTAGKRYYVEFWVSLSDYSNYSVSKIGVYFSGASESSIPTGSIAWREKNAQLRANTFLNNRTGWTKISGWITPTEQITRIAIGNFDNTSLSTNNVRLEAGSLCANSSTGDCLDNSKMAYYYIDDVIVKEDCPVQTVLSDTYKITGPTSVRTDSYGYFYDVAEPVPFATKYEWKIYPYPERFTIEGQGTRYISLTTWAPSGGYSMVCEVTTPCGIKYAWPGEYAFSVTNPWDGGGGGGGGGGGDPYEPYVVYPNPATDRLIIEVPVRNSKNKAADKEVKLYDMHGQLKKSIKIKGTKTELNTSDLSEGIYYLHIFDGAETTKQQISIKK